MPDETRSVAVDSPNETAVQHVVSPIKGLSDPRMEGASQSPAAAHGFDLLTQVGRGGMGVVNRARDTALGRDVAVKLLQERFTASPSIIGRFLAEARITAQLQHPGIPPDYEVDTVPDGRPDLAMKFIKGQTLDELLKERKLPTTEPGRFLAIFEQVCHAIGYAHEHGILDFKGRPDGNPHFDVLALNPDPDRSLWAATQ